jgi:hypothetical protein
MLRGAPPAPRIAGDERLGPGHGNTAARLPVRRPRGRPRPAHERPGPATPLLRGPHARTPLACAPGGLLPLVRVLVLHVFPRLGRPGGRKPGPDRPPDGSDGGRLGRERNPRPGRSSVGHTAALGWQAGAQDHASRRGSGRAAGRVSRSSRSRPRRTGPAAPPHETAALDVSSAAFRSGSATAPSRRATAPTSHATAPTSLGAQLPAAFCGRVQLVRATRRVDLAEASGPGRRRVRRCAGNARVPGSRRPAHGSSR